MSLSRWTRPLTSPASTVLLPEASYTPAPAVLPVPGAYTPVASRMTMSMVSDDGGAPGLRCVSSAMSSSRLNCWSPLVSNFSNHSSSCACTFAACASCLTASVAAFIFARLLRACGVVMVTVVFFLPPPAPPALGLVIAWMRSWPSALMAPTIASCLCNSPLESACCNLLTLPHVYLLIVSVRCLYFVLGKHASAHECGSQ